MGTTLTGTTPQDTYDSLIKVTDNGPIGTSLKTLTDGLGNDSALALSSRGVKVNTSATLITDAASLCHFSNNFLYVRGGSAGLSIGDDAFSNSITLADNADIAFEAGSAEAMRITAAGNVGIGTTAPTVRLQVRNDVPASTSLAPVSIRLYNNSDGGAAISMDNGVGGKGAFAFSSESTGGGTDDIALIFSNSFNGSALTERMRISATGDLLVGTTFSTAKFNVQQTSAARISSEVGNNNSQGSAQFHRVVRQYPVVSLGTKLIIPVVSQSNLNGNTIVRIMGHAARYNQITPSGFTAEFEFGSLNNVSNLTTLSSTENISSITASGSNIQINFTTDYTRVTADGVFVTIEYMCNNVSWSIDVANIAMN